MKQQPSVIRTTTSGTLDGRENDIGGGLLPAANASDLLHSIEFLFRRQGRHAGERQGLKEVAVLTPEDAWHNFLEGRLVRRYKKNQAIFEEGNQPKNIFYIEKGRVKIFKINDDGRELVMRLHGEGYFLCYVPVLENARYKCRQMRLKKQSLPSYRGPILICLSIPMAGL